MYVQWVICIRTITITMPRRSHGHSPHGQSGILPPTMGGGSAWQNKVHRPLLGTPPPHSPPTYRHHRNNNGGLGFLEFTHHTHRRLTTSVYRRSQARHLPPKYIPMRAAANTPLLLRHAPPSSARPSIMNNYRWVWRRITTRPGWEWGNVHVRLGYLPSHATVRFISFAIRVVRRRSSTECSVIINIIKHRLGRRHTLPLRVSSLH